MYPRRPLRSGSVVHIVMLALLFVMYGIHSCPPGLRPGEPRRAGQPCLQPFQVLPVAVAATIAAAGCDAARSPSRTPTGGETVTIRDSAGVEIVENHDTERARGQFWTLDPEPEFVLGGSEVRPVAGRDDRGGRILYVRGLARLVDGRIAVLSEGNHQLFIFESSGKLSKAIGGRGEGPGEFSRPVRMQYLPPDTLAVWDQWMGPVTYFDTAGVVMKRRPIDLGKVLAAVPGASYESPTIPLPDGSFVVTVRRKDHRIARPARWHVGAISSGRVRQGGSRDIRRPLAGDLGR